MTDTPAAMLAEQLARDPARPFLTYYDDAAGGRVELSVATLGNWVAKTANLCQDTLDLQLGDRVEVSLPAHWQTAAVLLACWSVGAVVTDDWTGARAAFITDTQAASALARSVEEVVALSCTPLGSAVSALPGGALDYAVEVPGHGDRFAPYAPVHDDAPALTAMGATLSAGELVALGRSVGLQPGDRVLTVLGYDTPAAIAAGLVGPLAVGASVVLCAHLDAETLPRRVREERVSVTVGVELAGVRRLDGSAPQAG